MNNLYVFAIGGSGERVVKSLVMMLTAGVSIGAKRIIPVFIDNDVNSNAFTTCCELIKYYNASPTVDKCMGANSLYAEEDKNPATWGSFFHVLIDKPIVLNKAGNAIGNLKNVIGYQSGDTKYHKAIEEEMNLLFTNDDMEMPLNVGFVGNPNIGSVVLNSLSLESAEFNNILNCVTPTDGVIVVGSLFGGTGAAGFPLVINKFKSLDVAHKPVLGGVAVLPYFSTKKDEKPHAGIDVKRWNVDSDAFITKSRAALMYYDDYMKLGYDYLYYIGDSDSMDVFNHNIGGKGQKNPYHIVDVMSALSIVDFSKSAPQDKIVYKSPVWGFNGTNSNISGVGNSDLARALAKFQIMREMFYSSGQSMLEWAIETQKNYVQNIGFTEVFRKSVIGQNSSCAQAWGLQALLKEFDCWLGDLSSATARRPFMLFNETSNVNGDDITTKFYSENEFGIAKAKETGVFSKSIVAVKADIASEMQKAYNTLYPRLNKNNVSQNQTLSMLLKIISKALDNVLDKNCVNL